MSGFGFIRYICPVFKPLKLIRFFSYSWTCAANRKSTISFSLQYEYVFLSLRKKKFNNIIYRPPAICTLWLHYFFSLSNINRLSLWISTNVSLIKFNKIKYSAHFPKGRKSFIVELCLNNYHTKNYAFKEKDNPTTPPSLPPPRFYYCMTTIYKPKLYLSKINLKCPHLKKCFYELEIWWTKEPTFLMC